MKKLFIILLCIISINTFAHTYGCVIGSSTVAASYGFSAVASNILTTYDTTQCYRVKSIAASSATIQGQMTTFCTDADKALFDWVSIEIGLNNLTESALTIIGRLQTLVDTIHYYNPTAKIILCTMTPCRQSIGEVKYLIWLDVNCAIMNTYSTNVTDVDYRLDTHTAALNDGNGNLAAIYDYGDHIHPNEAGRVIIGAAYRTALISLCMLPCTAMHSKTKGILIGKKLLIK